VKTVTKNLRKWYDENKRDLPWRLTKSAYKIWLSEIILQQTRVRQGIHYYERFLERFPDVRQLAKAAPEEVLKLWQGLGYYTRARNLHAAAKEIVSHYDGRFPSDYRGLLSLKGVGDYTAAAIASIAFNIPVAVVDGNVLRVLARLHGIRTPVTSSSGKKEIQQLAEAILDRDDPGIHNQSVMELGALICVPQNPLCHECPLKRWCYAFANGLVNELPVKDTISRNRRRYFHYLHITCCGQLLIHQRKKRDIWNSLFEFPLIETARAVSPGRIAEDKQWKQLLEGIPCRIEKVSPLYIHQLSHQTLYVRFYRIRADEFPPGPAKEYACIKEEHIYEYPVSKLTEKYLMSGGLH
jgi:A/G-specific adenine glycosylase